MNRHVVFIFGALAIVCPTPARYKRISAYLAEAARLLTIEIHDYAVGALALPLPFITIFGFIFTFVMLRLLGTGNQREFVVLIAAKPTGFFTVVDHVVWIIITLATSVLGLAVAFVSEILAFITSWLRRFPVVKLTKS
jgi:hypothetical protein